MINSGDNEMKAKNSRKIMEKIDLFWFTKYDLKIGRVTELIVI